MIDAGDRLGLQEIGERNLSPFATVARALVTAERCREIEVGAVQQHLYNLWPFEIVMVSGGSVCAIGTLAVVRRILCVDA